MDAEPRLQSILLGILISDPRLELHRLVVDSFSEFGESGGLALWWRPISSPTLADPIYKRLRSPELVRRDRNDARRYQRLCQKAGGEDNHVRSQYFKLARQYDVRGDQRPVIVLRPQPWCGEVATMPVAPAALETAERRRTLACFLHQEFSESRVIQFAHDGVFDLESVAGLQSHADRIAAFVAKSIARDRGVPQRMWDSYLKQAGLVERPDPSVCTTARAWLRQDGALVLRTETYGKPDGEVVFPLREGQVTRQIHLMWRLLLAWPRRLSFRGIAEDLYREEIDEALARGDRDDLSFVAKRLRSLVRDIRFDKLEPAGINPDVLATPVRADSRSKTLRLRLARLDRRGLGELSPLRF